MPLAVISHGDLDVNLWLCLVLALDYFASKRLLGTVTELSHSRWLHNA